MPYFWTRKDLTGKVGVSVYQKGTVAMWHQTYGTCHDEVDVYVRMSDSRKWKCMKQFAVYIVELYKDQFPGPINISKTVMLYQQGNALGLPFMLS